MQEEPPGGKTIPTTCSICKQSLATSGEIERHACPGLVSAPWSRPRRTQLTPTLAYLMIVLYSLAVWTLTFTLFDPGFFGIIAVMVCIALGAALIGRRVPADEPEPAWIAWWQGSGPVYWIRLIIFLVICVAGAYVGIIQLLR